MNNYAIIYCLHYGMLLQQQKYYLSALLRSSPLRYPQRCVRTVQTPTMEENRAVQDVNTYCGDALSTCLESRSAATPRAGCTKNIQGDDLDSQQLPAEAPLEAHPEGDSDAQPLETKTALAAVLNAALESPKIFFDILTEEAPREQVVVTKQPDGRFQAQGGPTEKRYCVDDGMWYTLAETMEFVWDLGGDYNFAMRMWSQMKMAQPPPPNNCAASSPDT